VHLAALGFNGFLQGGVKLQAEPGNEPRVNGDIRIDEGTFRAFSQDLEIERGNFTFSSSPIDNPGINVKATRAIDDVVVGVNALGTARDLTVSTFSSPGMSENDRISYLVTGKPAREGAKLSLNRQVYKNLTVGVAVDTHTGERSFVSRYRIHRLLHTEVSSSARSSAMDFFYTLERK
jgi:translocation and assembly module TamB